MESDVLTNGTEARPGRVYTYTTTFILISLHIHGRNKDRAGEPSW